MKRFFFLIMITALLSLSTVNALAAAPETGSFNLELSYGGTAIQGMGIRISLVAGVEFDTSRNSSSFKLADEYLNSGVNLSGTIDTQRNIDLSKELLNFAGNNTVTWLTGTTNANGEVLFSNLKTGLYLIAQNGGNGSYIISPSLLSLPYDDLYDVDVHPKATIGVVPPPDDPPPPPDDPPPPEDEGDPPPEETPPVTPPPPSDNPPPSDDGNDDGDPPSPRSFTPPEPPAPDEAPSDSPIFQLDPDDTPEGAPEFDPTLDMNPEEIPRGTLPQTGMLLWPVPILLSVGSGSVVPGVMIISKEKNKDEEEIYNRSSADYSGAPMYCLSGGHFAL
jgi:hypothetical protein